MLANAYVNPNKTLLEELSSQYEQFVNSSQKETTLVCVKFFGYILSKPLFHSLPNFHFMKIYGYVMTLNFKDSS